MLALAQATIRPSADLIQLVSDGGPSPCMYQPGSGETPTSRFRPTTSSIISMSGTHSLARENALPADATIASQIGKTSDAAAEKESQYGRSPSLPSRSRI